MNKPMFSGVCTALVTPFQGENIHYPMLQRLLQRQLDAGIHTIVLCGTTGEAPVLHDEEKLRMIRMAKEFVGSDAAIVAGTGSNCTTHARQLSIAAQEAGADGLLLVSPYYNLSTPTGLVQHYSYIMEGISIPAILYNVPSRTGMDIPVSVYQQLSQLPNIAGVKEASRDITKTIKIMQLCADRFQIWSGNDEMTVPIIALGGQGVISVVSNVAPRQTVDMVTAAMEGDFPRAAAMQLQLQPLIEACFCEVNPIPVKAAMKQLGLDCGPCRPPLSALSEANQSRLQQVLPTVKNI